MRSPTPPTPLGLAHTTSITRRAGEDLRIIRQTMQRAATFTSVPSWTGVLMGAVGLTAAWRAFRADSHERWLALWLGAAVLACLIALGDVLGGFSRERQEGRAALTSSARRFLGALAPSFAATALLTLALARAGLFEWLPPVWLLGYGSAVVAAGAISLPAVTWMGLCFLALGAGSLATPASFGDAWLAAGFGGLHVAFGLWIARHHRG